MKKARAKIKVLIALSGGVDSSVAATLLVKAGYDVTAVYMINYDDKKQGNTSCWLPDYRDAVRVAAKLNIPIIKLDFTKEYKARVLDYMFKEYEAGRTPNPDVLCNKFIKFGVWLEKAKELGFDFLATGHYAQVKGSKEYRVRSSKQNQKLLSTTYYLLTSVDANKDQTYFLHQLTQNQLQHVMFPIGEYTKPQVRNLAKKFNLPTAEKEESMGICFIGEVPMKEFLETKIKTKVGNVVMPDGTVVGKHDGLAFYTIGQRHIGLARPLPTLPLLKGEGVIGSAPLFNKEGVEGRSRDSRPLYVLAKRSKANELVVGFEDDLLLYKKEIMVTDVNWIGGQPPIFPLQCEVRLRHRQSLQKCRIKNEESIIKVEFEKSQRAVTPGQFAVFYKKGECLGGGVID